MSVREFILNAKYNLFSLVLHGAPEFGKSPGALAIAGRIAQN